MSGDGSINGQFVIAKGQGLSQAIRDELNLTQDEANRLGSVWTKIFEQVDKQQNENIKKNKGKIYTGGNDLRGSAQSNYVVQIDQAISFSKEIWDEIVRLVNQKLNKKIVSVKQDENFEATHVKKVTGGQGSKQPQGSGKAKSSTHATLSAQAKADAESVKVTVKNETKAFYEEEKAHAIDYAEQLKKILKAKGIVDMENAKMLLSKITPDTVAYVLEAYPELATDIDEVFRMGFGFNKNDVYKYLLKPLLERAKTLNKSYTIDGRAITIENAKDLSLEDMKKVLAFAASDVITATNERIEAKEAQLTQIQQTFDEANNLLAEVANMEPKPEISDYQNSKGNCCMLPDGRFIIVLYDNNGEINEIYINHDTTTEKDRNGKAYNIADICYTKDSAEYNIDSNQYGYEGKIKSGYDFEKLKALAEKIFGKQNNKK